MRTASRPRRHSRVNAYPAHVFPRQTAMLPGPRRELPTLPARSTLDECAHLRVVNLDLLDDCLRPFDSALNTRNPSFDRRRRRDQPSIRSELEEATPRKRARQPIRHGAPHTHRTRLGLVHAKVCGAGKFAYHLPRHANRLGRLGQHDDVVHEPEDSHGAMGRESDVSLEPREHDLLRRGNRAARWASERFAIRSRAHRKRTPLETDGGLGGALARVS